MNLVNTLENYPNHSWTREHLWTQELVITREHYPNHSIIQF